MTAQCGFCFAVVELEDEHDNSCPECGRPDALIVLEEEE